MAEHIEREAAIDACFNGWNNNAHDCAENIRSIPAADVRPVVRGKWEISDDGLMARCAICGTEFPCWRMWPANFCPNCGADMRES